MRLDEEWRVIPGHPDYMVSDMGRVKWLTDKYKYKIGDISTGSRSKGNYRLISIDNREYSIHRLVMLAFVGPCPRGIEVNHKNRKRYDNRFSNLEYVTHRENIQHARSLGIKQPTGKLVKIQLSEQEVLSIRLLSKNIKCRDLGIHFNLPPYMVRNILDYRPPYFRRIRIEKDTD